MQRHHPRLAAPRDPGKPKPIGDLTAPESAKQAEEGAKASAEEMVSVSAAAESAHRAAPWASASATESGPAEVWELAAEVGVELASA